MWKSLLVCLAAAGTSVAQPPAGLTSYQTRCAGCHGSDGNGGEHGPTILARIVRTPGDQELTAFLHAGVPLRGMPAFANIPDPEMRGLISFLRTLTSRQRRGGGRRAGIPLKTAVQLTDGTTMEGLAIGKAAGALQLRTADQRIHLLRKAGEKYREATSQHDWPSMHGQLSGNRYTGMTQITPSNVKRLAPKWVFPVPESGQLQGTPQVFEGIMYVPHTNTVIALDAGTGARLWTFTRPVTPGLIGNARSIGNNRSVSVAGDRVYMQTDNAHLLALNRFTGQILWETEMADWRQNYNTTGSLLAVENLVVAGTAGGEEGVRGFLAAYDQQTGKEVWRFWTVPAPGEKGSETWDGVDIAHGGGPTWLTGSYDPEAKIIYWPTGNAGPDFNGDNRKGDNLYTCSILALDVATGKLKWHFQATPHDEWDWDAVQPLVLVDAKWQGRPRKLLLQANRNGFLYVLDRLDGKMLLARPLVKKLTWAREIAPDGRPVMNPNQIPTTDGTLICPAVEGAANFFSTSYSPLTGLFYVNTLERCAIYTKRVTPDWEAGKTYQGGGGRRAPDDKAQKVLRAFDIQAGKAVWEVPQEGPASSWTGTLSTASGLVFFGDDGGAIAAADATSGKVLWNFPFTENLHTSPMTYMFDNKQYLAIMVGSQVYSFGLME
ncbi:MAG TPA: PQQ-binding-like beta-propeller repeat protein [Bryobacteraceae bacterium]|nr:PQQ-binding-like beta-propeller repeat protein [Bryobacteraceae bacterium]